MNDTGPLVGIDVGSTRVSVVVGTVEDDRLVIRGCGQAGHDGGALHRSHIDQADDQGGNDGVADDGDDRIRHLGAAGTMKSACPCDFRQF